MAMSGLRQSGQSSVSPQGISRSVRERLRTEPNHSLCCVSQFSTPRPVSNGQLLNSQAPLLPHRRCRHEPATASQDVTDLQDKLPADRMSMVGAVSVKFVPRNAANSIVLCEEWTGLRNR